MHFQLDFADDLTPGQIGLLMTSLLDLVNENALGGFCRNGLGRYDLNLEQFRIALDGEEQSIFVEGENERYALSNAMSKYVDAMKTDLANLKLEKMAAYFLPSKKAA